MTGTVEQKLTEQGITLPEPRAAMANYVGFVRTGNLLFVSGQVCFNAEGKLIAKPARPSAGPDARPCARRDARRHAKRQH